MTEACLGNLAVLFPLRHGKQSGTGGICKREHRAS
jgi:hypothetical protein